MLRRFSDEHEEPQMTMEPEREHWPKWTNHDHPIVPRHFAAVARPTRFRYSDQHLTWIERGGMTRLVRHLEEISDDASARIAAREFRTWAIAEGLLET